MTKHALARLNSRVQPQHKGIASRLLAVAQRYNDAALVAPAWRGVSLVVIVRHYQPVTLLYRDNGRVTTSHLRVSQVVTINP